MTSLKGKKLLVLGGEINESTLVRRAQELGVYVIVADYHEDWSKSPAKHVADEAWNISYADLDGLERLCREAGVNGVLAGYSEGRVEAMMNLCHRLGLPSYITPLQLEITRDKIKFKDACRKSGVPVVHEYAAPELVDRFPVIVKPVDRAGSVGVTVARDRAQLDAAYAYAMEMSYVKQVIIEDFIDDGEKIDPYYQILDGEIRYVGCSDALDAKANAGTRVVQSGWVLPSRHEAAYLEKVDPAVKRMIRDMGIQNGYIFFSGFARENGEFVLFECGFRLCGGHFYYYFPRVGGWNTMDLLLHYALTGSARAIYDQSSKDPELKHITVNVYAKEGVIGEIAGLKEGADLPGGYLPLVKARPGQACHEDRAILDKVGMVHFMDRSVQVIADSVRVLNENLAVTGTDGRDMIYDRVDPEELLHWWDS